MLVGLLIIGIALIFRGNESWKVIFSAAGLYLGGYFTYNLINYLGYTSVPIVIAVAIGAIIGAVILTFIVRVGLSAGFALLVYLICIDVIQLQKLYTLGDYYAIGAAILGFVVAYVLYKDFVHVVAGIIGAFAVYFSLVKLGVAPFYAEIAAAAAYIAGVALQEYEKQKRKRSGKIAAKKQRKSRGTE
jgi:hypothetical protein